MDENRVMVCLEDSTSCRVCDATPDSRQKKISIVVRPHYDISKVFEDISTQFQYEKFELVLQPINQHDQPIFLNDKMDKTLYELPGFLPKQKNILVLSPVGTWDKDDSKKKLDLDNSSSSLSPLTPDVSDAIMSNDDLALGASASPTELEPSSSSSSGIPPAPALPPIAMYFSSESNNSNDSFNKLKLKLHSSSRPTYVGLVNQAMTCYLNSLLQALYMTPEFRNALYKLEFNEGKEDKIPIELQKLFLNLQTSKKAAVETTDLTKSFGWPSTEAWQQHDIQELCRVMFDALEKKIKNTEKANLINILYEGKMIDYVKCLECLTEKSREDTFLDIPLPVRSFDCSVAYGSIEEALRAFVQPETLDDTNQYFCEKCSKKCDAHKGLKFKKFPYILTLHLKRFDFDYQTLHRIKLNDKVTFPQTLNLNSFINATDQGTFANLQQFHNNGHANGYSVDDCSTTDSGAAMEEDNCSGTATTASSSNHENELQEDDEGIDMSASTGERSSIFNEYLYELFAIMIHSGSASGGHYYAYIKEFENGEWYCFNDQTVTTISQEDIEKSFGGGSFRAYYSSAYSSSTNAYMLMYRQIDSKMNERAIKKEEFPDHIKNLLNRMESDEENKRLSRSSTDDILQSRVYFMNPRTRQMQDTKCYTAREFQLDSVLESAYSLLKIEKFGVPITCCRLLTYDRITDEVTSLEGRDHEQIGDIMHSLPPGIDFLLETREADEEFEIYERGGVTLKVYVVDLHTKNVDGPHYIRGYESDKSDGLKKIIAKKLKLNNLDFSIEYSSFHTGAKIFVALDNSKSSTRLSELVAENFRNLTYYYISVPTVEKRNLDILGIPQYEMGDHKMIVSNLGTPTSENGGGDVVDAVMMNGIVNGLNDMHHHLESGICSSPSVSQESSSTGSNSEDSSLSDGDRTLVDESSHPPYSQVSSTRHSPQLSSPEDENGPTKQIPDSIISDDEDEIMNRTFTLDKYYFRATQLPENSVECQAVDSNVTNTTENDDNLKTSEKIKSILKIYVDKNMKIGALKQELEEYVNVPAQYFKISRSNETQLKSDVSNVKQTLTNFTEGEYLKIELGRCPKKGERKAKIYFMRRHELSNEIGKIPQVGEFVFKMNTPVIEIKKQLIEQFHRIDAALYGSLNLENFRLWEKSGKNPHKIFSNDHELGSDLRSIHCEFIVEECEKNYPTTTPEDSLTLFVRRWHPSTLELDNFQEITLEKDDDLRKKLAAISDIPEEKIAFSRINSSFPCTNISLLTINPSTTWYNNSTTKDNFPIYTSSCGNVFFYKNNEEAHKELSAEERKELSAKEKSRLERIGGTATTSTYSPRKERALKIYLGSPPKSNHRDE